MPFHAVYPDADASNRTRVEALPRPPGFSLDVHLAPVVDDDAFVARCADADGILLGWHVMSAAVLARLPRLRCVSFLGIGASAYVDLGAARERGIAVCNTPGYGDRTVAEHALALMLAAARHVTHFDRLTRRGEWRQDPPGTDLSGATLALVGFGGIARALAGLVRGLEMRVVAWTPNPDRHRAEAARLGVTFRELDDALGEADVVSVHVALAPETIGLVDARRIARMRRGAILVNTARGPIVDQSAVAAALTSGHLGAAGLDVLAEEPPSPADPLLTAPRAVLTPHVAFNTPRRGRESSSWGSRT